MSALTFLEKDKLEILFEMSGGSVLDFSNNSFRRFVADTVGIDIYEEKYSANNSGSKANRLREFFKVESDHVVGKLLANLLEYWLSKVHLKQINYNDNDQKIYEEGLLLVHKLTYADNLLNIDPIQPNNDDLDFKKLSILIKESMEKDEPESALDRLHTFIIKYVRQLCETHNILYTKETPLHSLFGGYVKKIKKDGKIESEMTERILKSSISVLEAFNDVRNNKSFAHDNIILSYNESILICNNISNLIRFLEKLEITKVEVASTKSEETWDNLDF